MHRLAVGKPIKTAFTYQLLYGYESGNPPVLTTADATVSSVAKLGFVPLRAEVSVTHAAWARFFTDTQRILGTLYDYAGFSPAFTDLTLSGGDFTVSGRYYTDRNLLFFQVLLTPDGSATSSSTAGTTYLNNLPVTVAAHGPVTVVNYTTKAVIGTSIADAGTSNAYLPTWSGLNATILIFGQYFIER